MRLKTFHASTMTEAMQMIRNSLGDEAVIVGAEEDRSNGSVRVMAAVSPAFEIGDDAISQGGEWLQYDAEHDEDAVAEELTDILIRHHVPEDVIDHLVSCAVVMGYDSLQVALIETLEHLFSFSPLPVDAFHKPVIMVGPPGSGKTLAVAKMAARSTMRGLNVGVITTDTVRAGGVEQLNAFTKLMGITLQKAKDHKDLRHIVGALMPDKDQVLVDTSGLNPFDKNDIRHVARIIAACDARPVLVMPAGIDVDEAGEIARIFATLGVRDVLGTRVDIARRLGSLFAAAYQGQLSFCDVSNTPKVAQGLTRMNAEHLARMIAPKVFPKTHQDDQFSVPQHRSILHERASPSPTHRNSLRDRSLQDYAKEYVRKRASGTQT